jgi:hypothetical protein
VDLGYGGSVPIFDVSQDGCRLVFTREENRGDIWLLEAQQGEY